MAHLDGIELPRSFGEYDLIRRIAVGGMAEVYVAKTVGIGGFERLVAVKVIHPRLSEDDHFVQMLVEEAKISVLLNHPNIVQCFDLCWIDEQYFIVMEYIEGADAYKVMRLAAEQSVQLPIDVCTFVVSEILNGLDHAHTKADADGTPLRIVHRDVSPQNVLLSMSGEVKLADFGIAKAAMRSAQTEAGVIKGKYYYMSPEQAWGDSTDHRSDVFSAGVVLYELLTGQMLYQEDNVPALLDRVRKAEIEPPTTRRPDIPDPLVQIIMKALQKRPEDRFQSAREFQQQLRDQLHHINPSYSPTRIAQLMGELLQEGAAPRMPVPLPRQPRQGPSLDSRARQTAELPSMQREDFAPDVSRSVIFELQSEATRNDLVPFLRPLVEQSKATLEAKDLVGGGDADAEEEWDDSTVVDDGGHLQAIAQDLFADALGDEDAGQRPLGADDIGGRVEPRREVEDDDEEGETIAGPMPGQFGQLLRDDSTDMEAVYSRPAVEPAPSRPAIHHFEDLDEEEKTVRASAKGIRALINPRGETELSPSADAPTEQRSSPREAKPDATAAVPLPPPPAKLSPRKIGPKPDGSFPAPPAPPAPPAMGGALSQRAAAQQPVPASPWLASGHAPSPGNEPQAPEYRTSHPGQPSGLPSRPPSMHPFPSPSRSPEPAHSTDPFIARSPLETSSFGAVRRGPNRYFFFGVGAVLGVLVIAVALSAWAFRVEAPTPSVEIRSQPAGARVSLDGEELEGRTPITIRDGLRLGQSYELDVSLDGYERWTTTVQPGEGALLNIAYLKPLEVTLHVETVPSGASIVVAGEVLGTSPLDIPSEVGRTIEIQARHPDLGRRSQRVEVSASDLEPHVVIDLSENR